MLGFSARCSNEGGGRLIGALRLNACIGAVLAAGVATFVLLAFGTPGAAQAQAVGTFQKRASSPKPVTGVAADPTTNLIYAQGYHATSFYVYDPSRNTWTTRASAPSDLSYEDAGAAYLDGRIYMVYPASSTTMYVYDIRSNSWSSVSNPLGTGTTAITSFGGELYLAGSGAFGNGFVSYNPATNTTRTLASAPNFNSDCSGSGFAPLGATLAAYAGSIYGNQSSGCIGFATYDIATNSWNLLNPPGDTLFGAAIDPTTGTFYTSGYNGSNPSFYVGNIAKNTWLYKPFPYTRLDDGGMAYVSTPGVQGIYVTYGNHSSGFTRFVTKGVPLRLKLTATPRVGMAGRRLCVTFRATSSGKPLRRVTVRFARHRALTKASGKARLCVTPKKRGTYSATASKTGYISTKTTVKIK